MRHSLRNLVCGLLLTGAVQQASAFSLLGQVDAWQTPEVGYQLPELLNGPDLGGPMNLGEDYRSNLPGLTYGFDESFLNYFGTKGVEEVEKAIQLLNDLPAFSSMSADLSEYPMDTRRFNHRAEALFLFDIKSFVLSALLEQFGLASPERYTWTLRSRLVINNIPFYSTIKRNFDPVTFEPSSFVNGSLYTYMILQTYTTPTWEAVEFEVDPSLPNVSSVRGFIDQSGTVLASGYYVNNNAGLFYTGLTRDDVGGLRFLYRPENVHMETLTTNAVLAPLGSSGGTGVIGSDTTGGSPWGAPTTTVTTTNGTTTGTTTVTNAPVDPALRRGVDKLRLIRVDFDSMVGAWKTLTYRYQDTYITNSSSRSQLIQRALNGPDLLFGAADLGVTPDSVPWRIRRTINFVNNDAINGSITLPGPGTLSPGTTIILSKIGPFLANTPEGGEVDGQNFWAWGSYDGTTNAPVVYPVGTSIKALEALIMSGSVKDSASGSDNSPWQSP